MKRDIGLWIDHRNAVIVSVSGENEQITKIASNVEKDFQHIGSAPEVSSEDLRDRRFLDHLSKYYNEVISHIRDAESILIFGPGEAKGEFAKRLKSENLGQRIVGVETADKMNDHQIVTKVRQQFPVENLL